MNSPDPVPSYFGLRYIGWLAWKNAITVLQTLQAVFAAVLLVIDADPAHPAVPPRVILGILIANAVASAVLAQIKRDSPPPQPPQEGKI